MEDNRNNSSNNNSKNNGGKPDGKRPKINFVAMLLISAALVLLISVVFNAIKDSQYTETTYSDFLTEMEAGNLEEVELHTDRIYYLTKEEAKKPANEQKACFTGLPSGNHMELLERLHGMGVKGSEKIVEDNSLIMMVLSYVIMIGGLFLVMNLLTKHGYQVKAIEVMDASRRTTKLNAYFTGFGKLKTIVLYDNLVNAMSTEEICAVFAHELGHGLHKDVLKQQIMNFGNLLLMAVVVWLAVRDPQMHTAFGFEGVNYGFAYVLAGIGLGLTQPLSSMVMNAYSRHAEFRADRQAVQEGYGKAMVTALKKLAKENFAHLAPSAINVVLEYSHPPLHQRIAKVEEAEK